MARVHEAAAPIAEALSSPDMAVDLRSHCRLIRWINLCRSIGRTFWYWCCWLLGLNILGSITSNVLGLAFAEVAIANTASAAKEIMSLDYALGWTGLLIASMGMCRLFRPGTSTMTGRGWLAFVAGSIVTAFAIILVLLPIVAYLNPFLEDKLPPLQISTPNELLGLRVWRVLLSVVVLAFAIFDKLATLMLVFPLVAWLLHRKIWKRPLGQASVNSEFVGAKIGAVRQYFAERFGEQRQATLALKERRFGFFFVKAGSVLAVVIALLLALFTFMAGLIFVAVLFGVDTEDNFWKILMSNSDNPRVGIIASAGGLVFMPLLSVVYLRILGFGWLSLRARRHRQAGADKTLASDTRPPVVLLRSFTDDKARIRRQSMLDKSLFGRMRLEEAISRLLFGFGPVVAVGEPGERLPPIGAARHYVHQLASNSSWQQVVDDWIDRSLIIAIVAGKSHWLQWEFQRALTQGAMPRTIVIFPPCRKRDWTSRWQNLRQTLEGTPWHAAAARLNDHRIRALAFAPDGAITALIGGKAHESDYELLIEHAVFFRFSGER